ncbi:sigma-70 family RNA polymerase sigma factor [bacterium]|nr:sigma-70 family RNA polymerase sigma factor [bacterium]
MQSEEILDLINQALDGNQNAYAALVKRYQTGLYIMLSKMVNNKLQAEDLVQETFMKAFKSLASYNPEHAFSTWLYKIAKNNCIDYIRKKRLQAYSMDAEIEGKDDDFQRDYQDTEAISPEREFLQKERTQIIKIAIDNLPKKYHEAIILRHQEDKSYEEIAELLRIPVGTVKARIFRAREMLKVSLKGKIIF